MDLARVKELMHRQEDAFNQIMAAAAGESRDLSPDEASELDRITAEAEKLSAIAARASKVEAERAAIAAVPVAAEHPRIVGAGGGIGATYRQLFNTASASARTPYKSFNEFLNSVHTRDPRLIANTMTEGSGTAGGYLVPIEYAGELLDMIYQRSVILPRAFVTPMTAQVKHLVSFDFSDASTLAPGGLPLEWLTEGSQGNRRTGVTKRVVLTAVKAAIFADASSELAADASLGGSFEAQLTDALTTAAGYSLDHYFAFGSGSNQPVGVLDNSNSELVTVARATASTITWPDVVSMASRLHPSCYGRAAWFVHPEALPQLLYLQRKVLNATTPVGGDIVELGSQSGGLRLLGWPVVVTEVAAAQLGILGDLWLADLAGYGIGMRKEMGIESTNAAQWLNDKIDWRLILRLDAKPRWSAFEPYSANSPPDAATLSWAVALDVPQGG